MAPMRHESVDNKITESRKVLLRSFTTIAHNNRIGHSTTLV